MKRIDTYINEAFRLRDDTKIKKSDYALSEVIDKMDVGEEKAEKCREWLIRQGYDKVFDDIRIIDKSNNISLGYLKITNDGKNKVSYDKSEFVLYLNTDFNDGYIIRRKEKVKNVVLQTVKEITQTSIFIKNIDKLTDLFEKFRQMLLKRGYADINDIIKK